MRLHVEEVFERGGRELIDLLEYLVISIETDLLFVFAVEEYRLAPTATKAIALYDVFCSPTSPAQVSVKSAVPPRDQRIRMQVDPLRQAWEQLRSQAERDKDDSEPGSLPLPPRYLFDEIDRAVRPATAETIARIEAEYDFSLAPHENLPDGGMNAAQRHFVDALWQPHLRPHLVSAGFRRLANIA